MLGLLSEFVEELRAVGIPVSMVETLDASDALRYADLANPEALKAALGATLVKNEHHQEAFRVAFEVFFGLKARPEAPRDEDVGGDESDGTGSGGGGGTGDGGEGDRGDGALFDAIAAALEAGDRDELRRLVAEAVDRYAGIEPGRPVGGRYYFYRVMRRLDGARLLDRLVGDDEAVVEDPLESRLTTAEAEDRLDELRAELRREIVRRLVEDRGAPSVARTLRSALVEDIDLMHATREELARIERTVAPLARKLATRLAQRRKHLRRVRIDGNLRSLHDAAHLRHRPSVLEGQVVCVHRRHRRGDQILRAG
jgi:uncharacterized protein with von Willebrand factor type A (vWA) domain